MEGSHVYPLKKVASLMLDSEDLVAEASVRQLFNRALGGDEDEESFLEPFLLTFSYFTTPFDVLKRAVDEFKHTETKRSRILDLLELWVTKRTASFDDPLVPCTPSLSGNEDHETLEDILLVFIDEMLAGGELDATLEARLRSLWRLLLEQQSDAAVVEREALLAFSMTDTPPPTELIDLPLLVPLFSGSVAIRRSGLEVSPQMMAEALTAVDSSIFRAIVPAECLYFSESAETDSSNIKRLSSRANQIRSWVATLIVGLASPEERALMVEFLIQVLGCLHELRAFSSLSPIALALEAHPDLSRLKDTQSRVKEEAVEKLKEHVSLMDFRGNFRAYHTEYRLAESPKIPDIGLLSKDLFGIDDKEIGGPLITATGLINFSKLRRLAGVIREVLRAQRLSYNIIDVPPALWEHVTALPSLTNDQISQRSREVEAKTATPRTRWRGKSISDRLSVTLSGYISGVIRSHSDEESDVVGHDVMPVALKRQPKQRDKGKRLSAAF